MRTLQGAGVCVVAGGIIVVATTRGPEAPV